MALHTRDVYTEHPLAMDYCQLMLYLTDVDESTHCFSICPTSLEELKLPRDDGWQDRLP